MSGTAKSFYFAEYGKMCEVLDQMKMGFYALNQFLKNEPLAPQNNGQEQEKLQRIKSELAQKAQESHKKMVMIGAIVLPLFPDFFFFPSLWKQLLALRLMISLWLVIATSLQIRFQFRSFWLPMVTISPVVLFVTYVIAMVDADNIFIYNLNYMTLFVVVPLFLLIKWQNYLKLLVFSVFAYFLFFEMYSEITLMGFVKDGGLLLFTVAFGGLPVLIFRYNSLHKEIGYRLELEQAYQHTHKQNEALMEQARALEKASQEILYQKVLIEEKSDKITASIRYAKRIQGNMLPSINLLQQHLPESFVFYQPKDIVSGDFYWFAQVGDKLLLAAVDCTGHGVPGGFMSMMGTSLLNQIVKAEQHTEVDQILERLDKEVRKFLNQDYSNAQDGMDMSICCIDFANGYLEFAGAKNPLVYCQHGEVRIIKGDKRAIGGRDLTHWPFTKHRLLLDGNTSFYLFSDGYQDQFGGPEGRKFMGKRFRDLLKEQHHLPMREQQEILKNTLNNWMDYPVKTNSKTQEISQIDDVLVLGFRV